MSDCTKKTITTFSTTEDNCTIAIKNVPSFEDITWGDIFYGGDASKQIRKIIDTVKIPGVEVVVVDYVKFEEAYGKAIDIED